jgi:hypothetical protein
MPRDPHDREALMWTYWLPVHHPQAEEEEEEAVLRPEVEVVGAEVGAEVLHRPEVAGAVAAGVGVGVVVGVQGQDRSLRGEAAAVQREALFFLAEVEAVQV